MSPNTLETQGLINQNEYQKVAALTHSASPDAQKKIAGNSDNLILKLNTGTLQLTLLLLTNNPETLDFLGKVKDKAGDMERRLKDKDKHGTQYRSFLTWTWRFNLFRYSFVVFLVYDI